MIPAASHTLPLTLTLLLLFVAGPSVGRRLLGKNPDLGAVWFLEEGPPVLAPGPGARFIVPSTAPRPQRTRSHDP